jgi:hypothetical protein
MMLGVCGGIGSVVWGPEMSLMMSSSMGLYFTS